MGELLYRIKPLEWSEKPSGSWFGYGAMGHTSYLVYRNGDEIIWRDQGSSRENYAKTIKAAKLAAEKEWQKKIKTALILDH